MPGPPFLAPDPPNDVKLPNHHSRSFQLIASLPPPPPPPLPMPLPPLTAITPAPSKAWVCMRILPPLPPPVLELCPD